MSQMEKEEPVNIKREVRDWILVILFAVAATLVIKNFILVNAGVPTASMVSLIDPGDRLIGFRLAYAFDEPKRGDVVIFRYPIDESQKFIKRVIGLPGETVEIREGKIYIDSDPTPLEEDYLPEEWVVNNDGLFYKVPPDSYFVLGDNRNISKDARYWAGEALSLGLASTPEEAEKYTFVTNDQLMGKAIFKYYPHFKIL